MKQSISAAYTIGLLWVVVALGPGVEAAEKVTIYRDTWGVPNIYGESEEAISYAQGYAQAEDRPEQIFDNYRIAIGRLSETAGPRGLERDFFTRVFRSVEVSRENWLKVSPHVRACLSAFSCALSIDSKRFKMNSSDSLIDILSSGLS